MTGRDCFILTNSTETRTHSVVNCGVVKLVPFAGGLPQKKGLNPDHHIAINNMKGVCCVDQLSSVSLVTNVPTVVPDCQPQCSDSPQGWLHPTLPDPAKFDQVTKHKLLCKSPQEPLPVGGIVSAYEQKRSRTGNKSNISGLLQLVVLGSQTQQPVEMYTRPQQLKQISKWSQSHSKWRLQRQ